MPLNMIFRVCQHSFSISSILLYFISSDTRHAPIIIIKVIIALEGASTNCHELKITYNNVSNVPSHSHYQPVQLLYVAIAHPSRSLLSSIRQFVQCPTRIKYPSIRFFTMHAQAIIKVVASPSSSSRAHEQSEIIRECQSWHNNKSTVEVVVTSRSSISFALIAHHSPGPLWWQCQW